MSCSRLLNPKTQRLQFLPPQNPQTCKPVKFVDFCEASLPQSGGELSVNATKTGKIGHRQSIPLSLTGLLSQPIHCCRTIHITTIHLDTIHLKATVHTRQLYTLGQLYTLRNYTSEPSIVGSRRFDKKCCKYLQLTNSRRRRPNLILFPGKFSPQPEIEDGRAAKYKRANFTNIIFDTSSKALKPLLPSQMCCSRWK